MSSPLIPKDTSEVFQFCGIVNAEGGTPLTRSRDAGVEELLIGSPLKT